MTSPTQLSDDSMDGAPISCTVELTGDGAVTLRRDQGCTSADAYELCGLIARSEVEVIDLTP